MFTVDIIFREDILRDIVHGKQEKHRLKGKMDLPRKKNAVKSICFCHTEFILFQDIHPEHVVFGA